MPKIKVIIPAYNEQDSIATVIQDIPSIVDEIIVVSNNSTDKTEENAVNAGATVLKENRKGYGFACLKGMDYIASTTFSDQTQKPDIIVFLVAHKEFLGLKFQKEKIIMDFSGINKK